MGTFNRRACGLATPTPIANVTFSENDKLIIRTLLQTPAVFANATTGKLTALFSAALECKIAFMIARETRSSYGDAILDGSG
jgi:hypothetical protein